MRVETKKKLAALLLTAMPFIMFFAILKLSGGGIAQYHPSNSDELGYWREMYNEFATNTNVTGLNIYAGHETSLGNFSAHGVSPTVLWWLFGKIFGWHLWSIPVCNAFIVSLCFIAFLITVQPNVKTILRMVTVYAALSIVWLYIASSMMEIPNEGFMLVWAGLLYRSLQRENFTKKELVLLFLIYIYTSFARIIYFVFFFPILLLAVRKCDNWTKRLAVIAPFVAVSVLIYILSNLTSSLYPYGFNMQMTMTEGYKEKAILIIKHTLENFKLWFSFTNGPWTLIITRYLFTLIMVCYIAASVVSVLKTRHMQQQCLSVLDIVKKLPAEDAARINTAMIMFIAWVLQLALYDVFDWRDYRVLYPFIWYAVVIAVMNECTALIRIYFAVQFVTMSLANVNYSGYFTTLDTVGYESISSVVQYNENAASRWDNTVYQDIGADVSDSLLLEQGIGITWGGIIGNEDYIMSRRPRYIITKNDIDFGGCYTLEAVYGEKKLYILDDKSTRLSD